MLCQGYFFEARERFHLLIQAARIVASSMTDDELKETVTFLKTPGGKKYIEMQPQVMNGVVSSLDAWNRQLAVEMMVRVRAEMKKKGHDL